MSAICCISPSIHYSDESKSTLDFAARTMLVTTNAKINETVEYDDALVGEFEKEIECFKKERHHAEESRLAMEKALCAAEEQMVCLKANLELEKSRAVNLGKQNYNFMMQVEELTVRNEELELDQSNNMLSFQKQIVNTEKETELQKTIDELTSKNQRLETNLTSLAIEKDQMEWRLSREVTKSQRRKDEAVERRNKFKNKLANMTDRLREDIVELKVRTPRY